MTTRYASAAPHYLDAGYTPIPVHQKLPPVSGVTGTKRSVTPADVDQWISNPDPWYGNLAIRHEQTLAVDVDDGYGDKNGARQLADLAARHKLPPLPATYSTTARGDGSPSRQYLYRVPPGVTVTPSTRLRSKPCPAVELCYRNHRYTVCSPSVHPDTGDAYRWYLPAGDGVPPGWGDECALPAADRLATIPAEWWRHLYTEARHQNPRAAHVDTVPEEELLATFRPAGDHPEADVLRCERERWQQLEHVGHDDFFATGARILEYGIEGVPGAADAYLDLKDAADHYLTREGRPADELPRMVDTIVDRTQRNLVWRKCVGIRGDGTCIFTPVNPNNHRKGV